MDDGGAADGSSRVFLSAEKFNHGVSSEVKKQKWAEITEQVNALGENHREVLITFIPQNIQALVALRLFRGRSYCGTEGEGHLITHSHPSTSCLSDGGGASG